MLIKKKNKNITHIESILLFRIYHVIIIFWGVGEDVQRSGDEKAHGSWES